MDEKIKFWSNQSRWPRDTNDFVFLCRAIFQTGKALYPDQWTDADFRIGLVNKLPSRPFGLRDWELLDVYSKLRHRRPELKLPLLEDGKYVQAKPQFTDDQWSAAVELYDKLNADTKGPVERFNTAKSKLFNALADGTVTSCLRPAQGGEFSAPCPISWWNTERWGARFFWGMLNPRDPFSTAVGGGHFQWIFIEADSLQAFIKSLNPAPQTTIGGEAKCKSDLIAAMLKSPTMKPKSKEQFMAEMMEVYAVSKRGFARAWSEALRQTEATWDNPGAPKKSPQQSAQQFPR